MTAVRAGPFRMPYNDKVNRGPKQIKERQPLLPVGIWRFEFAEGGSGVVGNFIVNGPPGDRVEEAVVC